MESISSKNWLLVLFVSYLFRAETNTLTSQLSSRDDSL